MKRNWILALLLVLLLGIGLGVFLGRRFGQLSPPTGTALLRDFSVPVIAAKFGQTNWQVMEDRIYDPFPTFARSRRIARRIVLRSEMSEQDLNAFTVQFQQAVSAYLTKYDARNMAFYDLIHDSVKPVDNVPIRSRVDLPRRFYAIGDVHGVADIWYVVESGKVVLIASLIEGP